MNVQKYFCQSKQDVVKFMGRLFLDEPAQIVMQDASTFVVYRSDSSPAEILVRPVYAPYEITHKLVRDIDHAMTELYAIGRNWGFWIIKQGPMMSLFVRVMAKKK